VSPLHGNFIVNRGAATAADVLALIEEVRTTVAEKHRRRARERGQGLAAAG
jgi:UDP-N-acetylmuramate dehydrogenase